MLKDCMTVTKFPGIVSSESISSKAYLVSLTMHVPELQDNLTSVSGSVHAFETIFGFTTRHRWMTTVKVTVTGSLQSYAVVNHV